MKLSNTLFFLIACTLNLAAQQEYYHPAIPEEAIVLGEDERAGSCMSPNGPFLCDPFAAAPTYATLTTNGCCNTISPPVKNATYCYTFTSPGTTVQLNAGFSFTATGGYSLWFDNFDLYTCAPSCTALPAYVAPSFTYTGLTAGACYTWCFDTNMSGGGAGGGFTTLCPWMVYTGPLPIELQHFTAYSENGTVQLNWSTASETNCMLYEVERSADGQHFEVITQLPAHGTTAQTSTYSTIDLQPHIGVNYYRLRSIDYDMGAQISAIISCTYEAEPAIRKYYALNGAEVVIEDAPSGIYILEVISGSQATRQLYYHSKQ